MEFQGDPNWKIQLDQTSYEIEWIKAIDRKYTKLNIRVILKDTGKNRTWSSPPVVSRVSRFIAKAPEHLSL